MYEKSGEKLAIENNLLLESSENSKTIWPSRFLFCIYWVQNQS
jgi:hypothetical protein